MDRPADIGVLPNTIDNRSLANLRQRLVETGGRLIKHARCYWLMLAESHLTRRLFGSGTADRHPGGSDRVVGGR